MTEHFRVRNPLGDYVWEERFIPLPPAEEASPEDDLELATRHV